MARSHDGEGDSDKWRRWQFIATLIRILVEVADISDRGGSGPGCLP
jgi:hypothetical protein